MGFFKKLFSGISGVEQREVTIQVKEDIMGKKGMNDPSALIGMLLAFINENPHQIDSEIMDLITRKKLSIKNVAMKKAADIEGTAVTYLIEFS